MNSQGHPLDQLIADVRDKIAKAQRELETARVELATLERVRKAVGEMLPPARRRNGRQKITSKRTRALSEGWRRVLAEIGRHGDSGASLDEILVHCVDAGLDIERQTLRSQMSNYVKRGYLDRPREGVFRLTTIGDKAASIVSAPGNEGAPPESGGTP